MKHQILRLLKKSERYTKTDMYYLAHGMSWLSIGSVISSLAAILLAVALANLLPKEVFGTYRFILSIAGILAITTLGGINTSILQSVARGFEGGLVKNLKIKISWGLIGSLGALSGALYYFLNDNLELSISLLITILFIPIHESFTIYDAYLQGTKKFKLSVLLNLSSRIFTAAAIILTVFLSDNLFVLLVVYFSSWVFMRAFSYFYTKKKVPLNQNTESHAISYGKHISVMGVIGKLSEHLDNILLFHFLGPVQVAIFSFALAPVEQIRALYKNIQTLGIPTMSNRSIAEINRLFWKRFFYLLLFGALVGGTYALLAPFLFKILFPQYIESILFSQLLAAVLFIRLPGSFVSTAVQSKLHKTPKRWLYYRGISPLLFIIALAVLVPVLGLLGAVLSRILLSLSTMTIGLVQWKIFTKRYGRQN